MNYYRIFILSVFLALSLLAGAQENSKICAYLKDSTSGEPLIGAICQVKGTEKYSASNNAGYFCLDNIAASDTLIISYVGYATKRISISELDKSSSEIIYLVESHYLMGEVVVSDQSEYRRTLSGHLTLDVEELKNMPTMLGQTDILKSITLVPGITGGREGFSNLHVRGGSRDQNLVLLDGNVMYNYNHFGGFLSMFNAEVLKKVDVYKAGIPARYGDRLSSVIDVKMRDGNANNFDGKIDIGVLTSSLLLEGPIVKGKSSFLLGLRASYLDLIFLRDKRYVKQYGQGSYSSINFYDLNFKYTHQISESSSLSLSLYDGRDRNRNVEQRRNFGISSNFLREERNSVASLTFTKRISSKLFLNSLLSFSGYHFGDSNTSATSQTLGLDRYQDSTFRTNNSNTDEFRWKTHLDFWLSGHNLRAGIELSSFGYSFGSRREDFESVNGVESVLLFESNNSDNRGDQLAFFVEDEFNLMGNISANLGLRYSAYRDVDSKTFYNSLEPRISLRTPMNNGAVMKFSYMYATQYSHLLIENINGFESLKWVSSNDLAAPQRAHQWSLGYFENIERLLLDWSVEAYYKRMNNLLESNLPLVYAPDFTRWEDFIHKDGRGEAYGLEFAIERNTKKLHTKLGYTLGWNNRQFETQNNGNPYPFIYDRRHVADLLIQFPLPVRKFEFSILWTLQSGHAFSVPVGYLPSTPYFPGYYVYEEVNNLRLPAYHRLDIAIHRKWLTKRGLPFKFTFSIYNVYNRENALYLYVDQRGDVKQISQFPIMPTANISVGFAKKKKK